MYVTVTVYFIIKFHISLSKCTLLFPKTLEMFKYQIIMNYKPENEYFILTYNIIRFHIK